MGDTDFPMPQVERARAEKEIRDALDHLHRQSRAMYKWERYFLSHAVSAFLKERYRAAAIDAREIVNSSWNYLGSFNLSHSEFDTTDIEEFETTSIEEFLRLITIEDVNGVTAVQDENPFTPEYFEQLYADNPDPWHFDTSEYEQAKYQHTLSELPLPRFRRALEVGCANGALTIDLAPRCDRLVAVDVVEAALDRARSRCAHLDHVAFHNMRIPHQTPEGPFDLVLLSEVACYWSDSDLVAVAEYLRRVVDDGGHVLLVHYTDETGYPKTGDEAVEMLKDLAGGEFVTRKTERPLHYRLDLWQRVAVSRA